MSNRVSNAILRTVTGAWILNSGASKLGADEQTASVLQEHAATGVPQVKRLPAGEFAKLLAASEIGLGATLLTPFVSKRFAGAALTVFASGLLTMYFRNPALTEADGIRPTQAGLPLAKDLWLAAIGLALVFSGVEGTKRRGRRR